MVARIARQREWAYDRVLAEFGKFIDGKMREQRQDEVDLANAKTLLLQTERKLRNSKDEKLGKSYMQTTIEECHKNIGVHEYDIRNMRNVLQHVRRDMQALRQARPILVGPATLDSLINQEPDRYDYVMAGNLPFDLMFFEFLEPFRMGVPFYEGETEAIGLSFYNKRSLTAIRQIESEQLAESEAETNTPYIANLYYTNENYIQSTSIRFNPVNQAIFSCTSADRRFIIDMERGEVLYIRSSELSEEMISNGVIKGEYFHRMPLSECPNYQATVQIANLCTNLVNYINSHNTTFTRRNRIVSGRGSTYQGRRPPHQGRRWGDKTKRGLLS